MCSCMVMVVFFFFKQKTAYEMRISDWSSDVCSSDLLTDFLDLGLQCAACRWLFVEKDNVIRMLGEFWPDIFVILLVCSLVSFANQKFGIFVATPITLGSTALTLLLGAAGAT